jgi:hypothetical protein
MPTVLNYVLTRNRRIHSFRVDTQYDICLIYRINYNFLACENGKWGLSCEKLCQSGCEKCDEVTGICRTDNLRVLGN